MTGEHLYNYYYGDDEIPVDAPKVIGKDTNGNPAAWEAIENGKLYYNKPVYEPLKIK